jgi:DNA-binding transcriptional LysR family regulator
MRNAGLIELGRHNPDVIRQLSRNLFDNLQARRVDAIIIGAENSHSIQNLVFDRFFAISRVVLSADRPGRKLRKFARKAMI